ncbi:uncharacterized protein METZ01_LOCUS228134, partial [marine metagenome]
DRSPVVWCSPTSRPRRAPSSACWSWATDWQTSSHCWPTAPG